jgi:hypothetical protein
VQNFLIFIHHNPNIQPSQNEMNPIEYVIPIILQRLFVPESAIKRIQQELVLHRKVSGHPNVCRFISGAAHPLPERRGFAEYLILLEYCPGMTTIFLR